jgi:nucleoid-associated protein YgaU
LDEEKVRRAQERAAKARELAAAKKRVYVVQPGDSLSKIAKEVLGDASRWPEIFEANKDQIKDPNLIHPGQELRMPS